MKELIILLTAAAPVLEVRASIPLGVLYYKLPALTVIALSIIGAVLPVFPILFLLNFLVEKIRKIRFFDNFFRWLFEHTKKRSRIIEDLELVGLTIFMALPIPGAGVWTGVVAAYLLDIAWIPTFICAIIGTTIASFLVYAASLGIMKIFL